MKWYVLINTMPGNSEAFGTVISSHKSLRAAFVASRKAQPSQRFNPGAYVPTLITLSSRNEPRGRYVPRTARRPDADEYARELEAFNWGQWRKGLKR